MSEAQDAETQTGSAGEPVAERLKRRYGENVDPGISLDERESAGDDPRASSTILQRLEEHGLKQTRYRVKTEIARGGMGAILKVWDEDLRRNLAMKVVLGRGSAQEGAGTAEIDVKTLGRFLEEAQVTGQLDHPGIVPVHELGIDDAGHVYFTMRLVKGRDLKTIFDLVQQGAEGWTPLRALVVLLKVCEAMAYAHAKGVIHRDLKPANVMVGRFGEVYVMDWGLARVLGHEDRHDLRIKTDLSTLTVETDRKIEKEFAADDVLITMDGTVVGTPVYMSPEQARGKVNELDARTDVYAVGAMLYQLLTNRMPYVPPDSKISPRMVLFRLLEEPPMPVHKLAPDLPAELVAICEKAMARERSERYADMQELAEDVRAYLENRVVSAYETGALAEARKWFERNRPLAIMSLAAVVLLLAGLGALSYVQFELRRAAEDQANVLRLSSARELQRLELQADTLWPAVPARIGAYRLWLAAAAKLVAGLKPDPSTGDIGHLAQLAELRSKALPRTAEDVESGVWRLADPREQWWHDELSKLVAGIEAFADPETGLIDGVSPEHGWGVARRLAFAQTLEERTVSGEDARARWDEARASIADARRCPDYAGLDLEPVLGLLPLERDAGSGLWEFEHAQSGIVLVLLDGGELEPFFLSRQDVSGEPGFDVLGPDEYLWRQGLVRPTAAQLAVARSLGARAPWWTETDGATLAALPVER